MCLFADNVPMLDDGDGDVENEGRNEERDAMIVVGSNAVTRQGYLLTITINSSSSILAKKC